MAAGSSCWCRSVTNLALNCGRYQLRLASSESSKYIAKRGRYQRWLFWLLVGSGTAGLAGHNRLWERKQRRKLRVQIEGIGRFFRSICITFEILSPPAKSVKLCAQTQPAWGSSSHPGAPLTYFNDGGVRQRVIFYTPKNPNFRICLPKTIPTFFSIPQKIPQCFCISKFYYLTSGKLKHANFNFGFDQKQNYKFRLCYF